MTKESAKKALMMSSFTSNGEFFAAILPDGTIKVWNTSDGNLLAEWKRSDDEYSDIQFSCIACSSVGKKRKKEKGTCLVALGTDNGEVLTVDASATNAELKWKSSGHHHGRIVALSFTKKGHKLRVISTDGRTSELNSETGELIKEIKVSKKYISSVAIFSGDKLLAAGSSKIRVLSLEDGDEIVKFSTDDGSVQYMSMLDDMNVIITSGFGAKNLQVWINDSNTETVTTGPVLSMKHPPLALECKNGINEDDLTVLSVDESGIVYIWSLKTSSEGDIVPTKVKVEASKSGSAKTKKRHILAARLSSTAGDDQLQVHIAYGSLNSPQFALVSVTSPGEDIIVNAKDGAQENIENVGNDQMEVRGKKRAASEAHTDNAEINPDANHEDSMVEVQIDNELNEPTMGERLASLNILNNEDGVHEKPETSLTKPPSADSVHVLLKQALHADDRSLLLDCLFRQNEKVITNSVALLNPSDVFKLLESLISMIQSRGAVVSCALPWLKSLLLQHASSIMSQESSLIALNSLYQLIESRISTFKPALQLATSLDLLYTKTIDDGVDEEGTMEPIIFEDVSDEEESEEDGDAMETDDEEDNEEVEAVSNVSDLEEGSDGMVDY
ncbi:uncharacterized protein [Rutidosis leptorrhynchoides]|uniref:uncharacterized protein n=1 Tax=Rutidosis leptorrhynchoides TaxID=125765 RepID=UPI003A993240